MSHRFDFPSPRSSVQTSGRLARELAEQADRDADRGEWKQARVHYAGAVAADSSPASMIWMAAFLADRDECDEAVAVLERAWDHACVLGNPQFRAVCCSNLSLIHRRLGNLALARQFEQLSLAAEMESPRFQSEATLSSTQLCESAALSSDEGNHTVAQCLLRAADAAAKYDWEVDRATLENGVAVVAARLGLVDRALRALFRASRRHFKTGERQLRAQDLSNIGHLLQGLGRLAEAIWCFRRSSQLYADSGAVLRSREAEGFGREARRRAVLNEQDPLWN